MSFSTYFISLRSPFWCRPWKYNDQVSEFYVILEDKTLHKKADTTRHQEETELDDTWQLL